MAAQGCWAQPGLPSLRGWGAVVSGARVHCRPYPDGCEPERMPSLERRTVVVAFEPGPVGVNPSGKGEATMRPMVP